MSEEKIYGDDIVNEEIANEEVVNEDVVNEEVNEEVTAEETEQTYYDEAVVTEEPAKEPVVAKKKLAKRSLVFGILALITTLFVINYVFGLISLICGIVYLVKKADVKPKGVAIAGIVCASLSIIISTTIWVSAYNYVTKTEITDIIDDAIGLLGNEAISGKIEELTGGAINAEMLQQLGSGEEIVNNMVADLTGGAVDLATIEQFVGGKVSVDRIINFVGDVKEEDINNFMNEINTMDQETMNKIRLDLGGEVTYEKLEEKFGKDFTLKEIMEYIDKFGAQ